MVRFRILPRPDLITQPNEVHVQRWPILLVASLAAVYGRAALAQAPAVIPSFEQPAIHEIVARASAERVEADVRRLVGFGTRHTLSDTVPGTRGIGAARRWIFDELERISANCGGCLQVMYVSGVVPGSAGGRIPFDVEVVNPIAIQRGRTHPDRYVLLTAHYDSRVSDPNDSTSDAPGANDNASGTAGVLEAARLLTRYPADKTIVYAPLAGEEQGLHGGRILAEYALENSWNIEGVINTDVIGNSAGITGIQENTTIRVFAPGITPETTEEELVRMLSTGGELDLHNRQLARRIDRIADTYLPNLDALVILRLDRFGRGGDHRAFVERGFPAVRITETHEDYRRQHQDIRTENGVEYGDLPDVMDFDYLARVTAMNAATIASITWAPPHPEEVSLSGAVQPSTTIRWSPVNAPDLLGYRLYWRRPTDFAWTNSRWVGAGTEYTLENVVVDNWFFGVAAVDREGNESLIVFGR